MYWNISSKKSQEAIDIAERFVDGEASLEDLSRSSWIKNNPSAGIKSAPCLPDASYAAYRVILNMTTEKSEKEKLPAVCNLIRDIIGNPFRLDVLPSGQAFTVCWFCGKVYGEKTAGVCIKCRRKAKFWGTEKCSWLTPLVISLAQAAYDDRGSKCGRCISGKVIMSGTTWAPTSCKDCQGTGKTGNGHLDFNRLAILADALEEAGCDNEDLLMHCRGQEWYQVDPDYQPDEWVVIKTKNPQPHVRGCWVLDLILGKT